MEKVMKTIMDIFSLIGYGCFALAGFCCLYLMSRYLKRLSKLDQSLWMFCDECNMKWRYTAYGPPAPDDYICPVCEEPLNVSILVDLYNKVPRFENGVRKQPPTEGSN